MLTLREANILSTTSQSILYGFSVFMFILTMWILLRRREKRRPSYGMIFIACTLQLLATAELIVDIIRLRQGFLSIGPRLPGGPEQFFSDVSISTYVAKSCLYNAQTLILDGVVIYRAYIVWQKWYVVVLPTLGWLALLATSIALNVSLVTAADHSDNVFAAQTGRWITAVYAVTLATNLSASGLIAFRIWRVSRQSIRYSLSSRLAPVLRVVIESGAIYSITVITALITFLINTAGVYIILDSLSPIIVIVFNMIIIRVGFVYDKPLPIAGITIEQSVAIDRSNRDDVGRPRATSSTGGYEMKALEIEITQYYETDADSSSFVEVDGKARRMTKEEGSMASFRPSSSLQPS